MAEVFLARRIGPHGFQKRVALKCILPQYARDPDFVAMFIDEARLAAMLDHPSIVQVFDFGKLDGTLYLAMELVDGTNVNRLLRAVSANREVVPLPVALHIAIEAARALAYAHHLCDENGTPLAIVHRDVSPSNLLLTRRGQVKLADFGIARCAYSDPRTGNGHVRGKLGYMSPEQVAGLAVDRKSDVFTLATVLAEMLIGEPLFGTGTELDVLLRIRDADRRVLDRSPRPVPKDVRAALVQALAKHPEERPEAGAWADRLEMLLWRRGALGCGARELARLLHRLALVTLSPQDEAAHEPGARPTGFVDPEPVRAAERRAGIAFDARKAEIRDMLARLALEPAMRWEVVLADGRILGPLTYPELVGRVVAGEIDENTQVRRDSGELVPSRDVPELQRYLRSSALRWDPSEVRTADRRGSIVPGNILAIVHRITSERETGVLHLWDGRRRKKVYFVGGKPEFVASTMQSELLGEFLVARGMVMRMELDMALALMHRFGGRLGDTLVGLGVLRPIELSRAVVSQVRERYLEMFGWKTGYWAFSRGVRVEEETFAFANDPHELLRDAVLNTDPAILEAALAGVREKVLYPEPNPPVPLRAYGVPEAWIRLLDVHGDMTFGRIIARESAEGRDLEDVYRAFYLGLSCRLVKAA
jgi:serine/threonine-protein kinase